MVVTAPLYEVAFYNAGAITATTKIYFKIQHDIRLPDLTIAK
jgi:hypothetical protein